MSFCKKCGNKLDEKAVLCPKCGASVQPRVVLNDDNNSAIRMLIPVGRSGLAIAAGYAGLLSFIPGVGLAAIVLGVLALRDIKAHPEKHGAGRAWTGIILGVIFSLFSLMIFSLMIIRAAGD